MGTDGEATQSFSLQKAVGLISGIPPCFPLFQKLVQPATQRGARHAGSYPFVLVTVVGEGDSCFPDERDVRAVPVGSA